MRGRRRRSLLSLVCAADGSETGCLRGLLSRGLVAPEIAQPATTAGRWCMGLRGSLSASVAAASTAVALKRRLRCERGHVRSGSLAIWR